MNLRETIAGRGEAPFIIREGRVWTYADLGREVDKCCALLREIGNKRVVAITGSYGLEAAAWLLALAATRNIAVPLVGTDPREVRERIEVAGAEWAAKCEIGEGPSLSSAKKQEDQRGEIWKAENAGQEQSPRTRLGDRAGLILFSSGSTGRAKGMIHDLDTLMESYRAGETKGLRVLAFMGLDHIGGIDILFRGIASGSCLVVPGGRSPEAVCRLIEEARVEVLPATPSFLNLMLLSGAHEARDLSSLKIIGFGAEQMPAAVLQRLRKVFSNVRFQQKFGTSETNAIRTLNKPSDPLWIRIDDPRVQSRTVEGELWLKTPSRILGYINHESDRLTDDGWYRTGDLIEEDNEGFFRIVGRRESVINVGGEKVMPAEVEAIIGELPEVLDCRVFGEQNPLMGQVVMAEVVVAKEGEEKEVIRAVRMHCRKRMPPFKVPVKIRAVREIEMTARFKRKI